jgi:hypothetical protein
MNSFSEFIVALGDALLKVQDEPHAGTRLSVTTVDVDLPLEARLGSGAELRASLPRGFMATGFRQPLGRVVLRFAASPEKVQ